MPLLEVQCAAGHRSEILKRGAGDGPFACPECGELARRAWDTPFAVQVQPDAYVDPNPYNPYAKRSDPAFIDRAGGGKAAKTADHGYRPALTHTARCPECARRRNVAIVNQLPWGPRLMCEACGYTWIHDEATASDPLRKGFDAALRPGRHWSAAGIPSYEDAARAVN